MDHPDETIAITARAPRWRGSDIIRVAAYCGIDPRTVRRWLAGDPMTRRSTALACSGAAEALGLALPADARRERGHG